jgi:hypothetical protein
MRAAQLGALRRSVALGGKQAVRDAERRFPVRVSIAVPPEGFGSRLDQIIGWLDANCGADGWTPTPSSTRGVVNDALTVYFLDRERLRGLVVRSAKDRDRGWGVLGLR